VLEREKGINQNVEHQHEKVQEEEEEDSPIQVSPIQ